jgi:hypothetical protein
MNHGQPVYQPVRTLARPISHSRMPATVPGRPRQQNSRSGFVVRSPPAEGKPAMAKIRFWKWQDTDQYGLPCMTRFPVTHGARERPEDPGQNHWWPEPQDPNRLPTSSVPGSPTL